MRYQILQNLRDCFLSIDWSVGRRCFHFFGVIFKVSTYPPLHATHSAVYPALFMKRKRRASLCFGFDYRRHCRFSHQNKTQDLNWMKVTKRNLKKSFFFLTEELRVLRENWIGNGKIEWDNNRAITSIFFFNFSSILWKTGNMGKWIYQKSSLTWYQQVEH